MQRERERGGGGGVAKGRERAGQRDLKERIEVSDSMCSGAESHARTRACVRACVRVCVCERERE